MPDQQREPARWRRGGRTERALNDLSADELRGQLKALRQELRARGLRERLCRKGTPLSDEEIGVVLRVARRSGRAPASVADDVIQQKTNPHPVLLPVRGGEPVTLCRVEASIKGGGRWATTGMLWVSDGRLFPSVDLQTGKGYETLATGEYVLAAETPKFTRAFGPEFVAAWQRLEQPPWAWLAPVLLETAGREDTPQEALVTWLLKQVAQALRLTEESDRLVRVFIGAEKATPLGTLAELLRPTLTARRLAEREDDRDGVQVPEWAQPIMVAVERYLLRLNLIAPDLREDPLFEVPLSTLLEWSRHQEAQAAGRARQLREAVAQALGFKEREDYENGHKVRAWVAPATAARQKDKGSVTITETGRVYLNGQFRCIVEAKSAVLPQDDQIVRRMWTLATTHRDRISTLTAEDRALLQELFGKLTKTARIWSLARVDEDGALADSA